jgi:hypothetical protein
MDQDYADRQDLIAKAIAIGTSYEATEEALLQHLREYCTARNERGIGHGYGPHPDAWDQIRWTPDASASHAEFYARDFDNDARFFSLPYAFLTDPQGTIAHDVEEDRKQQEEQAIKAAADAKALRERSINQLKAQLAELLRQEQ